MPKGPRLPATKRYSQRRMLPASTKSGTVYRQMPEKATMMMAGVETKPAETAASPNTSAPTTDRDMPTYLGIRMLASFSTSRTSSREEHFQARGEGKPLDAARDGQGQPRGRSWVLKSWEQT